MFHKLAALSTLAISLAIATPGIAGDADPQAFLEGQRVRMCALVGQPRSPARDAQLVEALDAFADFEELSRRTLGQPCPVAEPSCQNHWATLGERERAEVTRLLRQLVARHITDSVERMLDYEVAYRGTSRNRAGDTRVRTLVTSRTRPREPALEIDYVVRASPGGYRVVDIVTEGSSLTRNYYDQIHGMLTSASNGYAFLVGRLSEQAARK